MTEEEVRWVIAYKYPKAKFHAYSHTNEFMEFEARIGKGFHYVSLYDERIDSNHIETADDVIIVGNTYLPSFAYNLTLAWLYESGKGNLVTDGSSPLVCYNFKKFWGEQLYHQVSNVFSRAILLETLLYEQRLMVPVFEATAVNDDWRNTADFVASAMSNLVLFHELGHYYLQYLPEAVNELFTEYSRGTYPLLNGLEKEGRLEIIDEVKCDMIATLSLLKTREEAKATQVLQSAIMGHSVLAVLYSIQVSAAITAEDQMKTPDDVNLQSIETSTQEYSYLLEISPDTQSANMLLRANLMVDFCMAIANMQGINLYDDKNFLDIDQDLLSHLLCYIPTIMGKEDPDQRKMARLVSEAFHRNAEGMEYLYLKSKVFKSSRPLKL